MIWLSAGASAVEVAGLDILWHCEWYVVENADGCCIRRGFSERLLLFPPPKNANHSYLLLLRPNRMDDEHMYAVSHKLSRLYVAP